MDMRLSEACTDALIYQPYSATFLTLKCFSWNVLSNSGGSSHDTNSFLIVDPFRMEVILIKFLMVELQCSWQIRSIMLNFQTLRRPPQDDQAYETVV